MKLWGESRRVSLCAKQAAISDQQSAISIVLLLEEDAAWPINLHQ
jgi:hypothetical protein